MEWEANVKISNPVALLGNDKPATIIGAHVDLCYGGPLFAMTPLLNIQDGFVRLDSKFFMF